MLENIKNNKIKDINRIAKELNCETIKQQIIEKINLIEKLEVANAFDTVAEILLKKNSIEYQQQQQIKKLTEPYLELLKNSDYKAIKYAEGQFTDEEYQTIKEERQQYRDSIIEIKKKINAIKNIKDLDK